MQILLQHIFCPMSNTKLGFPNLDLNNIMDNKVEKE